MKVFNRVGVMASVVVLASCSYFSTGETIEVTSESLDANAVRAVNSQSIENIVYTKSKGSVEIYNLDLSEAEAAEDFEQLNTRVGDGRSANGMEISNGVEVFPIDIPMQNTLKPTR